jgi:hypothetical protein
MQWGRRFLAFALGALISSASAYDTSTHAMLSDAAANNSVLVGPNSILNDLFLPELGSGTDYPPTVGFSGSALNAIRVGAVHEDTIYLTRVFNHFYDPQHNGFAGRGLDALGITGNPSPTWAVEDTAELADSSAAQIFSYRQAQQYFFLGLTTADPNERRTWLARMFQSLGHVMHHIQDMAQPQHTRNDPHLTYTPLALYEAYTRDRFTTQEAMNAFLTQNTYPQIPVFNHAREFWLTPGATTATYRGMAEFSSENFVSRGTEFRVTGPIGSETILPHSAAFPFPNGSGKGWERNQPITVGINIGPTISTLNGRADFVVGVPTDGYLTTSPPWGTVKLASTSLLDRYLTGLSVPNTRLLIESPTVFDDMHRVLLPRAQKFSAGLINHFFRGRLDLRRSSSTSTTWIAQNMGALTMSGQFWIYAQAVSGTRTLVTTWSTTLAPSQTHSVTFPDPSGSPFKLALVFKGKIGQEPVTVTPDWFAVAGKVVDFVPQAIQCGSPISAAGSSAGYHPPLIEMGTTAGTVRAEFEAYSIPDSLVIRHESSTGPILANTNGLVSGFHNFSWIHNGSAQGSTKIHVNLTGNTNPQTLWTLTVGCPGQTLDNDDRPQDRISVWFGRGRMQGSGCQTGFTDVSLNGTHVGRINFDSFGGAGLVGPVTVTAGTHQLLQFSSTITNFGSPGFTCSSIGSPILGQYFYDDRAGQHIVSANGGWIAIQ